MFQFFMATLLIFSSLTTLLSANSSKNIEKMMGSMLMVGFHGTSAKKNSQICKDIKRYNLAGVILFDYNPIDKKSAKNIASKEQLAKLTKELQACSKDGKLLIAVDQEGGRVQRLKHRYGFYGRYPKAADIHKMNEKQIKKYYRHMAQELRSVGINYDLAPVVDLDINPRNHVIHGLGRSFGSNPKAVAKYATLFVESMHQNGLLTSLKHFPGHGSSTGDTHKGFVDVTAQWQQKELDPYRLMIAKKRVDTIMVAHVFNKRLDRSYPATLSQKVVTGILRGALKYHGVVITDDLQMGAISKKYGLSETLRLAINAGDDILLFGNQLDPRRTLSTKKLINTMYALLKSGKIKLTTIQRSNKRVARLKSRLRR